MLSMWNGIAGRLRLPNVDFLLQGQRVERREWKTEKQADASVEHSESLTESMLDVFWAFLGRRRGQGYLNAPSWAAQATGDRPHSLRYRRL